MYVSIYDTNIKGFRAVHSEKTDEPGNYNRIEVTTEGYGELTLWLTQAQADQLRAALDQLYPPVKASEGPTPWDAAVEELADREAGAPPIANELLTLANTMNAVRAQELGITAPSTTSCPTR